MINNRIRKAEKQCSITSIKTAPLLANTAERHTEVLIMMSTDDKGLHRRMMPIYMGHKSSHCIKSSFALRTDFRSPGFRLVCLTMLYEGCNVAKF